MDERELLQFLQDNKEDIIRSVKVKAIDAMTEQVRWGLSQAVQEVVNGFVAEEVIPALKAHLQDNKGPIIAAAIRAASEIGDKVSEKLITTAVESMTGYRGGEVIKALMGVR